MTSRELLAASTGGGLLMDIRAGRAPSYTGSAKQQRKLDMAIEMLWAAPFVVRALRQFVAAASKDARRSQTRMYRDAVMALRRLSAEKKRAS